MHGEIEQLVLLNDSVVGKMHAICWNKRRI